MAYYQFTGFDGEPHGSCEVFHMSAADVAAHWSDGHGGYINACGASGAESVGDPAELAGWYWWACFPGCLPDGDPMGPFPTEREAMEDADVVED